MKFNEQTGTTIEEAFNIFHKDNPHIYQKFAEQCFLAVNKGKKKTSAKMIINVIRWHSYLETNTDDEYRINDAFSAHYARKFIEDYPQHNELFELRRLRDGSEKENTDTSYEIRFGMPVLKKNNNRPSMYDF